MATAYSGSMPVIQVSAHHRYLPGPCCALYLVDHGISQVSASSTSRVTPEILTRSEDKCVRVIASKT